MLLILATIGVLLWRWYDLKSDHEVNSWFSREALFFLNTILFIGIIVVCLWGMLSPIITGFFGQDIITLGPEYYKKAAGPLFGALVILMGIAPLSAWSRTNLRTLGRISILPIIASLLITTTLYITGIHNWMALGTISLIALSGLLVLTEFGRSIFRYKHQNALSFLRAVGQVVATNRRRYGGYIIHFSVILMALGIVGIELFQVQNQATLKVDQAIEIEGYSLTFRSLDYQMTPAQTQLATAKIEVTTPSGRQVLLSPRMETYLVSEQTVTLPAVRSTLKNDLYVVLTEWHTGQEASISLKVFYNPLVNWLWIGGGLAGAGYLGGRLAGK